MDRMKMDDFTKAKDMIFPRDVLIGHDTLPEIAKMCDGLNFADCGMIVSGENTYKSAGRIVNDYMVDSKYNIHVKLTGIATLANVKEVTDAGREYKAKFLLAVGGGSKIDIAKMAAMDLNVPFVSIPTSAAHDGIASGRASLKSDMGPKSIEAVSPLGILADTGVIYEAPYRSLASGCADVISNLTALKDWEFANRLRNESFSSSAYALALHSANTIIENSELIRPGVEESTWIALRPIIISGIAMSVAGSSRPASGSEHMFSHALDVLHPGKAMHGEQCGVGSIMMMYLHGGDWMMIRTALKNIGAPVNADQLGLKPEDIIDALVEAQKIRKDRFTILGDRGLDAKTAEIVAKKTLVI
ncbi:MAG: NAD(P)-dependent glycerol-1-phosphate dehydrogenase [Candidatus Methanomethylophilaceae archaeon]